jgi:small Trp-rich protein
MWLIWLGVALIVLKLLEISVFATMSWWWIVLLGAVAFV